MSAQVVDSFIPVQGGELFVRQWQVPNTRAPIILLHDSLGSVEQWRTFPQALAQRTDRSVVAYDRLGFGQSSPRLVAAQASFINDEAQQYLPTLLKQLGFSQYLLFGHSVGGGMALAHAAYAGNRCLAVISESAQAFVEERTLAGIRAAKHAFADPAQFAKLEKWHGERAHWVLAAWTDVWLAEGFTTWSLDADLPRIQCPVLALHGDQDEFGSEAFAQRICSRSGGPASLALLSGYGHVPHRENADEVLERISAFLALHNLS